MREIEHDEKTGFIYITRSSRKPGSPKSTSFVYIPEKKNRYVYIVGLSKINAAGEARRLKEAMIENPEMKIPSGWFHLHHEKGFFPSKIKLVRTGELV